MKTFFGGLVAGVVLGGIISVAVAGPMMLHWHRIHDNGRIYGLFEAVDALEKNFGSYDGTSQFTRVFNVKCADVVAVEVNGVKTVRVARPVHGAACGHP